MRHSNVIISSPNSANSIWNLNIRWFFSCFLLSLSMYAQPSSSIDIKPSYSVINDSKFFSGTGVGENEGDGEFDNSWRRLRLGLEAKFYDRYELKFSSDYIEEDNQFELKDLYIKINALNNWGLKLGRFREPLGMEDSLSIKKQAFLERSIATNVFTFGRENGFVSEIKLGSWFVESGIFLPEKEGFVEGNPIAYSLRVSNQFELFDALKFHWGVGGSHRDGFEEEMRLKTEFLTESYGEEIRTKKLQANYLDLLHLEFASAYDHFLFQVETFSQNTEERDATKHSFNGFYTGLYWNIIGKGYQYKKDKFSLKKNKRLTLEAAVRYSEVDLESYLKGDTANSLNAAISAYWLKNYKIALEYEQGELSKFDEGESEIFTGESLSFRVQVSF